MNIKSLRCGLVLAICCSLLITSAGASYIVSAGTKTGATSTYWPSVDFDIYGNIEYDYFGEDTDSSYDYVIDLLAMSAYITNRSSEELGGAWFSVDCNSNYGSTLNSINYSPAAIPAQTSWQHRSVNWVRFAELCRTDTKFRFNENEMVLFNIGVFVDVQDVLVNIGHLETRWTSSGRTSSWCGD